MAMTVRPPCFLLYVTVQGALYSALQCKMSVAVCDHQVVSHLQAFDPCCIRVLASSFIMLAVHTAVLLCRHLKQRAVMMRMKDFLPLKVKMDTRKMMMLMRMKMMIKKMMMMLMIWTATAMMSRGRKVKMKVKGKKRLAVMGSHLQRRKMMLKQRKVDMIALKDSLFALLVWHAALALTVCHHMHRCAGCAAMEVLYASCPCTSNMFPS